MPLYRFVTTWRLQAPADVVWETMMRGADYPRWWKCIVSYRNLTPGLVGVGSRGERAVRGRLPYSLQYVTTTTLVDRPHLLEYSAAGDLHGHGRMILEEEEGGTRVTFHWNVDTTGRMMNLLAPLLKPVFAWNHNAVMKAGERGLRAWVARSVSTIPTPG